MNDLKTNKMLVNVVLDRSGSMADTREGTISGYNEYINGLRADRESEYDISLIQFDAHGHTSGPELTISYTDKPLAEVPKLTAADYEPRGATPLYDAIGECARRVEPKNRAVTVVIITDGMENASKEFTKESVKALIGQKTAEGWTFVFLGAEIDSYAVGGSIGMTVGATSNYAKGMESRLYANTAGATLARARSNRRVGVLAGSTMAFFSDEQKKDMGDTQASPSALPPRPAPQGGSPTGRPTFPATQKVERKKREWATSGSR